MSTAGPLALPPPAVAGSPGIVGRVVRTPILFCLATLVITVAGLALDSQADLGSQVLLGLCTWGFLAIAFIHLTPMERAQTSVVVVVATCAEVIGSVIWGVYTYRLGNLPLFVPPGHGLVYLTGLRLSQMRWFRVRPRLLVGAAMTAVGAWALIGLIALGRTDIAGAVGATVLLVFLWRGRAPAVYAGVFFAVAFLEIYGTAMGTWTWAGEIPGLGVSDGNPPSGAASGYVFFDIAALALAPVVLAVSAWVRRPFGVTARGRLVAANSRDAASSVGTMPQGHRTLPASLPHSVFAADRPRFTPKGLLTALRLPSRGGRGTPRSAPPAPPR